MIIVVCVLGGVWYFYCFRFSWFWFFLVSVFKIFFGLRVILYLMGKLDRGKGGKWLRIF